MGSLSEALVADFKSRLSGLTVYEGTVPDGPSFPYVLVLPAVSSPSERSLGRSPVAPSFRVQTTVVGLSAASVRIIAASVRDALEGARLAAPGLLVGRLEEVPNAQPILEDRDVTDTATGLHPLYQPLEWTAVLSQ